MTDSNNNNRNTDTNAIVIEHYNQRPRRSFDERNQSPILHLRNFNNWIKGPYTIKTLQFFQESISLTEERIVLKFAAILIQKYCRKGYFVLDYAGGKGGDLRKWVKACIGYLVLIGIVSLRAKNKSFV
jgi:mRNA (guanine-N7-)-methyltransferase